MIKEIGWVAVVALGVAVLLSAGLLYYYVFLNPHIWYSRATDASYYLSIANSLSDGTGFYDLTSSPKSAVVTTQNGIVYIEYILMTFGVRDNKTIFAVVAVINYFIFLTSATLLYKVISRLDMTAPLKFMIVVAFLLSSNIFTAAVMPTNDGFSLMLCFLALLLSIRNYDDESYGKYFLVFVLVTLGVQFRLQNVLVPICCSVGSLLFKRYRAMAIYMAIAVFALLSIYLPYQYLLENNSGVRTTFSIFSNYLLSNDPYWIGLQFSKSLVVLFMKFGEGMGQEVVEGVAPAATVGAVLIACFLVKRIFEGNFALTLMSLLVLSTMALVCITPAPSFRYLMIVYPLLMAVMCASVKFERTALGILGAYLIYGFLVFAARVETIDGFFLEQQKQTATVMHLFDTGTPLLSEIPRVSYLVFNRSSRTRSTAMESGGDLILFGTPKFIATSIDTLSRGVGRTEIESFGDAWVLGASRFELVRVRFLPVIGGNPPGQ